MKSLSRSQTLAHDRRARYYDLRDSGIGVFDAAAEIGINESGAIARYERWYQAERVRGEIVVRGKTGPRRG